MSWRRDCLFRKFIVLYHPRVYFFPTHQFSRARNSILIQFNSIQLFSRDHIQINSTSGTSHTNIYKTVWMSKAESFCLWRTDNLIKFNFKKYKLFIKSTVLVFDNKLQNFRVVYCFSDQRLYRETVIPYSEYSGQLSQVFFT